MVIQRWQSVWLLVASICVALFCFLPMAVISIESADPALPASVSNFYPSDNMVVLIVGLLIAALLVINIFLYKNTRRQKMMTIVSIVLIAVLASTCFLMIYGMGSEASTVEWLGSILLLLGAVVFSLLAYRGIRHDENLLRAADRLR